jgi:hypothetical protein
MSKTLNNSFYRKRIQLGMRTSNPLNWWRDTNWLTGQTSRRHEAEGDYQSLANMINDSPQHISYDLFSSVYEYDIHPVEVYHKLSKLISRKLLDQTEYLFGFYVTMLL